MTCPTPPASRKILFLQLLVIVCFAFSLYFFLYSSQEERSILHDLDRLSSKRVQLEQTITNVAAYDKLLLTDSTLAHLSSDLKWEQVDFNWKSLAFTELLRRIEALSHQQKIFVLESFTAEIQDQERTPGSSAATHVANDSSPEFGERIFHMRGYFLCPSP